MVFIKWMSLGLLLILLVVILTLYYQLNNVPSLVPYLKYFNANSEPAGHSVYKFTGPRRLTATYMGTSTVLISDDETSIMTDGFFSRPSAWDILFGRLSPDISLIKETLSQVSIHNLAAVIPIHSHHDHAMDAPVVAGETGATLVGSESTANIGRGWGLEENQIKVVTDHQPLQFGKFKVQLIATQHAPAPDIIKTITGAGQTISQPMSFPAELSDFKEGGSYSVFIEHPLGNVLIHGSAGFKKSALAGIKADVVFLGIGGLGKKPASYQQEYFNEVVEIVGATRVVPVHWDDFTHSFHEPLQPMSKALDDFDGAMNFIIEKTQQDKALSLHMMGKLETLQLYDG